MVEDNNVLVEKVDALKNVVNSLMRFISIWKFSQCRESMAIVALKSY